MYEAGLAGMAHALSVAYIGEAERAVAELLRAQRMEGTVDEWVPGYVKEMKEVGERRFEEVTDEGEREAVLRSGVAMRLRMILERKRDGRRKGRLVAQGFLEPGWMTQGKEDSPVASGMSIKALFFGAAGCIDDDVIGAIDVSTAFLQYDGEEVN